MSVQVSYKKQFVLMLFLIITLLVVVEVLVNIWLYNFYRCDFEEQNQYFKNWVNEETSRKICLESLEYNFMNQEIKKIDGTIKTETLDENLVYINSEGFRGPEFSKVKPENTFRIFSLGGSSTFGLGVLDNQTYPYYYQQMLDDTNLDFNFEVINAGWSGWASVRETNVIKDRFLDYEPDLFIVLDGFNEIDKEVKKNNPNYSATLWKERWIEACNLGKQKGFGVIVTLQPLVNSGKKLLTVQESEMLMKLENRYPTELYLEYADQLNGLEKHCNVVQDLRGIYNDVSEPIFFDYVHVGPRGNQILAENMYTLSLPLINDIASEKFSNKYVEDFPNEKFTVTPSENAVSFLEETNIVIQNMFYQYKTPRIFSLIFK